MDASRILVMVCGFALSVSLFFSVGALTSLRHAVSENSALQEEAEELVDKLDSCLEELDSVQTNTEPDSSLKEEKNEDRFLICSVNRVIGVYNESGDLLRVLDVSVDSLPKLERERLEVGVHADSWQAVETFLEDYDA